MALAKKTIRFFSMYGPILYSVLQRWPFWISYEQKKMLTLLSTMFRTIRVILTSNLHFLRQGLKCEKFTIDLEMGHKIRPIAKMTN
jgi:hypothetical protein